MKKYLIASFMILFSSSVYADRTGKGLMCECLDCETEEHKVLAVPDVLSFYFVNNDEIQRYWLHQKNDKLIGKRHPDSDRITAYSNSLKWIECSECTTPDFFELDRKSLILEMSYINYYLKYQCNLYDTVEEWGVEFKKWKRKEQLKLDNKLQGNKL